MTAHWVYHGQVVHARFAPVAHRFRYTIGMLGLDLDRIEQAFRGRWLWSFDRPNLVSVRRADHLRGGHPDWAIAVRDLVEQATGTRPAGRIELIAQPRYLGYCFNPLSLYLCNDAFGALCAVVLEVHNTPWGEQHVYVVPVTESERIVATFDKAFHVSPFMPMDLRYRMELCRNESHLRLQLDCYRQEQRLFAAWLDLTARPMTAASLAGMLLRTPLMSLKTVAAIYWEALRLFLKRAPFFPHPSTSSLP